MTARVCHSETRSLVPRTEIGFVGGPLGRMTDIARPRTRVAPVRGIRGALVVAAAGFVGWACTGRLSGLLGAARRGAGNGVADGGVGVAWGRRDSPCRACTSSRHFCRPSHCGGCGELGAHRPPHVGGRGAEWTGE